MGGWESKFDMDEVIYEQPLSPIYSPWAQCRVLVTKRGRWRAILESAVSAIALQVQRHQLSIEIAKVRILHVTLLIFVLTYERMDAFHVEWWKQTREQRKSKKQRKEQKNNERKTTGDNLMDQRRKCTQDKTPMWSLVSLHWMLK